jgi:hypothetical protein
MFRVSTGDCEPASEWEGFGSEVAIKRFSKETFYAKVKNKFLSGEEQEEECEKLCRRAFNKECEMLSRFHIFNIFLS